MKWLLALAIPALVASCATKVPGTIAPPPPKAKPVAPEVSLVRDSVAATDKAVAVLDAKAKEATRAATIARAEAERLKNKQSASAAELQGLWESLQSVEARNLFLEAETSRLTVRLSELGKAAAALEQKAADKDAENAGLQIQNDVFRGQLADFSKAAATAEKKAEKAEKDAEKKIAAAEEKERAATKRAATAEGEMKTYKLARNVLLGVVAILGLVWGLKLIFFR